MNPTWVTSLVQGGGAFGCAPTEHCCDHSSDTGRKKLDPCSVTRHIKCIHILDISSCIKCIGEIWGLSGSSPFDEQNWFLHPSSSFLLSGQVAHTHLCWLCQSYFAGLWHREPESLTRDCEFCEAGRSVLKALAGFHLKDWLSVDLGFRSVFQISLNSSCILLPCDGENCEPLNNSSDHLRNMFRRELSVNSSYKDASWICVWCLVPNHCTILVCSSAFKIFTFLLGR